MPRWGAAGALGWRAWARASAGVPRAMYLHTHARLSVHARTVRAEAGSSAAQVLQHACSHEAGSYVVARDEAGAAVPLDLTPLRRAACLTFLPFDADDKLAQRTFWMSTAMVVSAALQRVCPHLVCAAPTVTESMGSATDGTSGFALEMLRGVSAVSVPATEDLVAARHHVDAAMATLLEQIESHGAPKLSSEELSDVERLVKQWCSKSVPLRVQAMPWDEAYRLFHANPLLLRSIVEFGERDEQVSVVFVGDDAVSLLPKDAVLVQRTKALKSVKLLGWSTASLPSFLASPTATQPLLRVRGISFPSAQELQAHQARVAEAEKMDHRYLGLQQGLFFAHDSSPGSPFMMPHGMRLLRRVERVIRDLYDAYVYEEVQTPQLYRSSLWKQSGHWDKYRDDMFSAQGFACCDAHDDVFGLKPMNCPGHCVIFSHQPRSYRELPLRLAEFSPLHRNEASGALSGLTRVRRFHQDDAHVFCAPAQVAGEIESMLHMLSLAYRVFGFGDRFELVLSTRPSSYLGEISVWDQAEASLKAALDASGRPWSLNEGDGAFYGPKIDIRLVDAMGRKHQTATVQLDFQLPERFQLEYAVAPHEPSAFAVRPGFARPVMIHRAILGSFERFLAILLEQCRGWWPFWLNPRQAVVIPVFKGDEAQQARIAEYARDVQHSLSGTRASSTGALKTPFLPPSAAHHTLEVPSSTRFHVELPATYLVPSGDTLAKKVRQAQFSRYNFVLIVGEDEMANGTVSVRLRDETAAPAWHAGTESNASAAPAKVCDIVTEVARATFPERWASQAPSSVDWGAWSVADLRRLFCVLDALHV